MSPLARYHYITADQVWRGPNEIPAGSNPGTALPAPTNLVATEDEANNTITLDWDDVVGAALYEIWETATTGQPVKTVTVSTRTSPTLLDGSYNYSVRAVDANGNPGAFATAGTVVLGDVVPDPDPDPNPEPDPPPGGVYVYRNRSNTGIVGIGVSEASLTSYPASSYQNVSNLTLTNRIINGDLTLKGSNNHLIGCKVQGSIIFREGTNCSITDSDAGAIAFQSVQTGLAERNYVHGKNGTDAAAVSSDFSMCSNITYRNNAMSNPILSAGAHYDTIQVRGCNGLNIIGNTMNHGDSFDSRFNATIFIMTELGGASNIIIRGNHLKATGYYSVRIYGVNQLVEDNIFYRFTNGSSATPMISSSSPYTSNNNLWSDGSVAIPNKVAA